MTHKAVRLVVLVSCVGALAACGSPPPQVTTTGPWGEISRTGYPNQEAVESGTAMARALNRNPGSSTILGQLGSRDITTYSDEELAEAMILIARERCGLGNNERITSQTEC